jgi:hypothetical protein
MCTVVQIRLAEAVAGFNKKFGGNYGWWAGDRSQESGDGGQGGRLTRRRRARQVVRLANSSRSMSKSRSRIGDAGGAPRDGRGGSFAGRTHRVGPTRVVISLERDESLSRSERPTLLKPNTPAVMHGSSFVGQGDRLLTDLPSVLREP